MSFEQFRKTRGDEKMKLTTAMMKRANKKFWAIALSLVLAMSGIYFGTGQVFGQEGEEAYILTENEYLNFETETETEIEIEASVQVQENAEEIISAAPLTELFVGPGQTVHVTGDIVGNVVVHGTLILDGPYTITGTGQAGSAVEGSAAVNVQGGGRFIMTDGVVTAPNNIGVLVNGVPNAMQQTTFEMHGGLITGSVGRIGSGDAGSAVVVNRYIFHEPLFLRPCFSPNVYAITEAR